MAKISVEEFFQEMKNSLNNKKLTPRSLEIFIELMNGIISKNSFKNYNDLIKLEMSNYALKNFERYWNNFTLYNKSKEPNNPYSYFYRLIKQSYISILKEKKIKEFNIMLTYDPMLLNKGEEYKECCEINFNENIEYFTKDIYYDYSEIVALIDKNIGNFHNKEILEILYCYFDENIVYKFLKNDKILLHLLENKYKGI